MGDGVGDQGATSGDLRAESCSCHVLRSNRHAGLVSLPGDGLLVEEALMASNKCIAALLAAVSVFRWFPRGFPRGASR
eukprot:8990718-Alexandrium_andersonii.AAC.1